MAEKIESEMSEKETLVVLKEAETKEQVKNEFEEKMKVERKRFQETLNSLRQEIERLQIERNEVMNEISKKQGDPLKQVRFLERFVFNIVSEKLIVCLDLT